MTPSHRAARANQNLSNALVRAANRGERTPCSDVSIRDMWVSEDQRQRQLAAHRCVEWQCPVLTECGLAAIANRETYGVWGGRDYTQRPGKKLQRDQAA
jgi:hypothetical protein